MKLKDYGLTAQELKENTQKYMIELCDRFPFVAERAKGMYVYDSDGRAYLDFYAGIAVDNAGHCNDKVVAAVKEQVEQLMHVFNYVYTVPQSLLAKRICDTIGMDKIFYQNSGTEANEAMIKLARRYGVTRFGPKKYHIVTARQSFHGRTLGSVSATGQPGSGIQANFGDLTPGFSYAEFNDLDSFRAAVTEDTIGIMVEPVQGEGGVHPATVEFMKGLRQLCDEKSILLLLDEVQTGWCRTGEIMAFMHYGVKPDIVSMAKAMGGGMPIGAICARADVAEAFTPGTHGTTFGGNPVSCAGAYAEIGELLDRDLAGNARQMGPYFMEKLKDVPYVKDIRGLGCLVGVEFQEGVDALAVKHKCCDLGLLITALDSHVIRMVPPLILTKEDCDTAARIIKEAVKSLL